ncbi:type II toxin -antitoxin system TacA 1-like antitoxin [Burkholderia gladioli]|uniref:type II toxin -antitoxin system TacA 1-like antitoxin n=2 Tax=Burkholderia gladioli TaxID=28095 RepID=UPI0031330CBD
MLAFIGVGRKPLVCALLNAVQFRYPVSAHCAPQPMAITRRPKLKTATLTVRLDPKIKAAAEAAAEYEHRSLTNFLEVLIVNHCQTLGLSPEHFAKDPR